MKIPIRRYQTGGITPDSTAKPQISFLIPKVKGVKDMSFQDIPSVDNKKVVINNFSPTNNYIVEGGNVYAQAKNSNIWHDISDNKQAQKNLLTFIDKNNYWPGYGTQEHEIFDNINNPNAQLVQPAAPSSRLNKFSEQTYLKNYPTLTVLNDHNGTLVDNSGYQWSKSPVTSNQSAHVFIKGDQHHDNIMENAGDYMQWATNGISRMYTKLTGNDQDPQIKSAQQGPALPKTASEYYNKPDIEISHNIEVPNSGGRTYKQETIPLSSATFGYRNRGQYDPIKTDGLELTTFNGFSDGKDFGDNQTVIALDKDGNIKTGQYKDFKNQQGYSYTKTFMNRIESFQENGGNQIYKSGQVTGNPNYQHPVVNVIDDHSKIVNGILNVMLKDDQHKDYYGSIQGGRVLFVNPNTKQQYLVAGSTEYIKNKFNTLKGSAPYLEAYTLDNGTYSRGLSYKDSNLSADRLKKYDLENSSGGNGLYIKQYTKPVNKFNQIIVSGMPNIRSVTDSSYINGHPLKNEVKNIVLHHTAYEDPVNNDAQVNAQYMTPGQNSSHVVIEEDGTRRIYASPEQVTFHAGVSEWKGRTNVNDFAVGVEFQGNTDKKPLTEQQIQSFIEYATPIMHKYGLNLNDLITHKMITSATGRKPDISDVEYKRIEAIMNEQFKSTADSTLIPH